VATKVVDRVAKDLVNEGDAEKGQIDGGAGDEGTGGAVAEVVTNSGVAEVANQAADKAASGLATVVSWFTG